MCGIIVAFMLLNLGVLLIVVILLIRLFELLKKSKFRKQSSIVHLSTARSLSRSANKVVKANVCPLSLKKPAKRCSDCSLSSRQSSALFTCSMTSREKLVSPHPVFGRGVETGCCNPAKLPPLPPRFVDEGSSLTNRNKQANPNQSSVWGKDPKFLNPSGFPPLHPRGEASSVMNRNMQTNPNHLSGLGKDLMFLNSPRFLPLPLPFGGEASSSINETKQANVNKLSGLDKDMTFFNPTHFPTIPPSFECQGSSLINKKKQAKPYISSGLGKSTRCFNSSRSPLRKVLKFGRLKCKARAKMRSKHVISPLISHVNDSLNGQQLADDRPAISNVFPPSIDACWSPTSYSSLDDSWPSFSDAPCETAKNQREIREMSNNKMGSSFKADQAAGFRPGFSSIPSKTTKGEYCSSGSSTSSAFFFEDSWTGPVSNVPCEMAAHPREIGGMLNNTFDSSLNASQNVYCNPGVSSFLRRNATDAYCSQGTAATFSPPSPFLYAPRDSSKAFVSEVPHESASMPRELSDTYNHRFGFSFEAADSQAGPRSVLQQDFSSNSTSAAFSKYPTLEPLKNDLSEHVHMDKLLKQIAKFKEMTKFRIDEMTHMDVKQTSAGSQSRERLSYLVKPLNTGQDCLTSEKNDMFSQLCQPQHLKYLDDTTTGPTSCKTNCQTTSQTTGPTIRTIKDIMDEYGFKSTAARRVDTEAIGSNIPKSFPKSVQWFDRLAKEEYTNYPWNRYLDNNFNRSIDQRRSKPFETDNSSSPIKGEDVSQFSKSTCKNSASSTCCLKKLPQSLEQSNTNESSSLQSGTLQDKDSEQIFSKTQANKLAEVSITKAERSLEDPLVSATLYTPTESEALNSDAPVNNLSIDEVGTTPPAGQPVNIDADISPNELLRILRIYYSDLRAPVSHDNALILLREEKERLQKIDAIISSTSLRHSDDNSKESPDSFSVSFNDPSENFTDRRSISAPNLFNNYYKLNDNIDNSAVSKSESAPHLAQHVPNLIESEPFRKWPVFGHDDVDASTWLEQSKGKNNCLSQYGQEDLSRLGNEISQTYGARSLRMPHLRIRNRQKRSRSRSQSKCVSLMRLEEYIPASQEAMKCKYE